MGMIANRQYKFQDKRFSAIITNVGRSLAFISSVVFCFVIILDTVNYVYIHVLTSGEVPCKRESDILHWSGILI